MLILSYACDVTHTMFHDRFFISGASFGSWKKTLTIVLDSIMSIKSDFASSLRHWPLFLHWDFRCRASVVSDIAFHHSVVQTCPASMPVSLHCIPLE